MKQYIELLYDTIETDLGQRAEEGADVAALRSVWAALREGDPRVSQILALHEQITAAPIAASAYVEPQTWDDMKAACGGATPALRLSLTGQALHDRILGGWLGRCAGCLLGKPVEGIYDTREPAGKRGDRRYIRALLESAGAYPLRGYVPYLAAGTHPYHLHNCWPVATRGHIDGMPRDDDMDYPILNLLILEKYGRGWTQEQALGEWLRRVPYLGIYAAGRAAYRNAALAGSSLPTAAHTGQGFRQSLGGMIRADLWGWVSPGRLHEAADLAYRDSAMSQTLNGVYAGVFWAAAVAAAFAVPTAHAVVAAALAFVPPRSRLAEAVHVVLEQHRAGSTWEQATDAIYDRYAACAFNHSLPNTAIAVMGLLYGEGDFSLTIERTVMAGFDTDCTGATVGSIMGVMLGASGLPARWIEPLHDRVTTIVAEQGTLAVSNLARRTVALAAWRLPSNTCA